MTRQYCSLGQDNPSPYSLLRREVLNLELLISIDILLVFCLITKTKVQTYTNVFIFENENEK